ncbi:hypothetical protein AXK30_01730 [Escherichia coli]|nr:hypothetical protein AXK30_01730 [Escherichia coli]
MYTDKNRLDYLTKTVESIINDNVDVHAYEIVIADNSDDDLTEKYARELMDSGYNIKYYKNPQTGFYNSIQALQLGDGAFLKLHNDYTSFNKGGFKKLFDHVVKIMTLEICFSSLMEHWGPYRQNMNVLHLISLYLMQVI